MPTMNVEILCPETHNFSHCVQNMSFVNNPD